MRLPVPGDRRVVLAAMVAVVVVWSVTGPAVAAMGAGDVGTAAVATGGAPAERPTPAPAPQDDDCVVAASGAYPGTFEVTCETVEGEESIRVRGQGGWAYAVYMNASETSVLNLDFGSQTTVNETVRAGELAFVGAISAQSLPTDTIREAWRSQLRVDRSEVGVAVQSSIRGNVVPGSDPPKVRLFRPGPGNVIAKPGPGTYRLRLVAYEQSPPIPAAQGGTTEALRAQTAAAIERSPTRSATVTVRLGRDDCETGLESEETSLADITQQRETRADATGLSKGAGGLGLSSVESLGQLVGAGPSDAMTDGLPDLSGAGPTVVTPLDVARKQQAAAEAFQNVADPPDRVDPDGTDDEYGDDVRVTTEQPEHLTAEEATDATVAALAERGIEPPRGSGLSLEDYVRTDTRTGDIDSTWDGDHFDVTKELEWRAFVRVGPNGDILPKHSELPEVDPCEPGTLQKSTTWLKIKFHHVDPGEWDVVVQRIEVATGSILESNYAGWNEFNPDLEPVTESAVGEVEWLGGATDGTVPESGGEN